jgi:DNA-binding GntR family transcriptional regulator
MWGQFEPGQPVTIGSLATQFGTSHMPVREALRRLGAENALEIGHNGTARVPTLSRRRLDDICQVRASLEGLATELAGAAMTSEQILHCLAIAQEHEALGRSGKVREMLRKNQEFHFAIYGRSGSDVLPQMIEVLWLQYGPYMRLLSNLVEQQVDAGVIHPYSTYHYEMIDAFKVGDAKKAGQLMVKDVKATQLLLQKML